MPMSAAERELRLRLERAVREISAGITRCPSPRELDAANVGRAAAAVTRARVALDDAVACVGELAALGEVNLHAVVIVEASRALFPLLDEVLDALDDAIDRHLVS